MSDPSPSPVLSPFPAMMFMALDGTGKATQLDPAKAIIPARLRGRGFTWVHLQRDDAGALAWLEQSDLDAFVVAALTADETRPRCTVHGDGVLLNLRGVNLNPGAEPEDMISIRLWLEEKRVISLWGRPLSGIQDLVDACTRHLAPVSPGDFVSKLTLRLSDRAEPVVATLNERIDGMEEQALSGAAPVSRHELSEVRRTAIILRRYLFPQRDALTTLEIEDVEWLHAADRSHIREAADRVTRLAEELDAIRDRAQIVHEQIMDQRAEAMNRQMLLLSIVAAIFLPLGLITGLLGINVGGIPGTDNPLAFWFVAGGLVIVGLIQTWLFRKLMLSK